MARQWTHQERNILKQMWASKQYDYAKIGRALKKTPAAVEAQRRRLGLATPPGALWAENERDRLRNLWEDGHTVEDIAWQLSRSVEAIRGMRRKLGLKRRRAPNGHGTQNRLLRALVSDRIEEFVRQQAGRKRVTVATYLRTLIERDYRRAYAEENYNGKTHYVGVRHDTRALREGEGLAGAV